MIKTNLKNNDHLKTDKKFRLFFWTTDEWSCPEYTKKVADKIAHMFLHFVLVTALIVIFKIPLFWSFVAGQFLGFLYEWIIDCWFFKCGASKFDLLANFVGGLIATGIFWIGAQHR